MRRVVKVAEDRVGGRDFEGMFDIIFKVHTVRSS